MLDGGEAGSLNLAKVGARIERRAHQHRGEGREGDAHFRQSIEEEKDLYQLRGIGGEGDVGADDPAHGRGSIVKYGRAEEPDQHAAGEGKYRDLKAEPGAAQQVRPLLEDGGKLQRQGDVAVGSYNIG